MKNIVILLFSFMMLFACASTKEQTKEKATQADKIEEEQREEIREQTNDTKECLGKPIKDCNCTMQYAPVCGCDGKTYGNACEANCAGVKHFTIGKCGKNSDL